MSRSRAERRKDPDQWWRVSGMASEKVVLSIGGGEEVYLKGDIQGATVVQLPAQMSSQANESLFEGIQGALKGAGIENAVIVPAGVEFLCVEPVSLAKAKELDKKMRLKISAQDRNKTREGLH